MPERAASVATADIGSPAAALAALSRVDPVDGGAWHPGAAATGVSGGVADDSEDGFAVARSSEGDSARSGNRVTWANPWFPDPVTGPSQTVPTVDPADGEPGGDPDVAFTGPPRAVRADAAMPIAGPLVARTSDATTPRSLPGDRSMPPVAREMGGFVARPRSVRIGSAIQRSALPERAAADSMDATSPAGAVSSTGVSIAPGVAGGEAPGASGLYAGFGGAPTVARLADDGPGEIQLAPLQRVEAGSAEASPGTGSTAGSSPTSDKDLDDLARRLYDRFSLRLRRDLLVERERAGALVDRGF